MSEHSIPLYNITMAQASQLSKTLYAEFTPTVVKLIRQKAFDDRRTVYIPKDIVKQSALYKDDFDKEQTGEKTWFEKDGWRVSASPFRGNIYICYIKLNNKGARSYLESMNISKVEYSIVIDILRDEDHPEEIAPDAPLPKRRRLGPMVTSYRWRYVDETGHVVRTSSEVFLDKDECLRHGEEHVPELLQENVKLDIECKDTCFPNPFVIVNSVYAYLMQMEFRLRIRQQCYGCQFDRPGQEDHMSGGCLDEDEVLIESHAKPCHVRISIPRLQEATEAMLKYFPGLQVSYGMYTHVLRNAQPQKTLGGIDDFFFYEFCMLDKL